jgi:hypothetical protein
MLRRREEAQAQQPQLNTVGLPSPALKVIIIRLYLSVGRIRDLPLQAAELHVRDRCRHGGSCPFAEVGQ